MLKSYFPSGVGKLRRVPFHIRKVVDKKLIELEELDIIESVQGPTPWVSPLVAVPKANGEVRVCVDMRRANEAVIRERYPIPTLEETVQALNGETVFSKLDLRWGYHQIELHPDSRGLTTFSTPQGLNRSKRLIFGLSSASEMYQFVIQQVLIGIPGVATYPMTLLSLKQPSLNMTAAWTRPCNACMPTGSLSTKTSVSLVFLS
jgi:hypothetical protein